SRCLRETLGWPMPVLCARLLPGMNAAIMESRPVSSNFVAAPEANDQASAFDGWRSTSAALALVSAALIGFALHRFLPDGQGSSSNQASVRPYPVLLLLLLVVAGLTVGVQALWRSSRPWVRHYAPLGAGAVGLLCLWDLMTQKLGWLPMPFFPGPDRVF